MPKGIPNKRYTPELKQMAVEAVVKEGLSCCNSAIAISSFVFMVNCCNFFLYRCVFICFLHLFQMIPNKRYTPELKQMAVEAVVKEGLSYNEAARIYGIDGHDRIQSWERIYLTEFPQSLIEYRTHQQGGQTPVHPD